VGFPFGDLLIRATALSLGFQVLMVNLLNSNASRPDSDARFSACPRILKVTSTHVPG